MRASILHFTRPSGSSAASSSNHITFQRFLQDLEALFAKFRARLSGSSTASSSGHITDSENIPWTLIGEAKDHLLVELEQLYWIGVEHELESILFTLKAWQSPGLSNISLDDESDTFIHGFDSFIDQVSEESRGFADQVGMLKDQVNRKARWDYLAALEQTAQATLMEHRSSQLKAAIRQAIEGQESDSPLRRRTRMLLQEIGLLDIEKLVEHRPPLDKLSFWKRPAIPQLQLHKYNKTGMPILTSQQCHSCGNSIRASMYCKESREEGQNQTSAERICEDCYRKQFLGKPEFVKKYKHCILNEIITPSISRKICNCDGVPRYDIQGKPLALFPMSKINKHFKPNWKGRAACELFNLGQIVAEAKYDGMRTIVTKVKLRKKGRNLDDKKREDYEHFKMTQQKKVSRPKTVTQRSHQAPNRDAMTGTTVEVEEAEADEDIPFFLRRYTEKYPFGNVHMALRIGPIVIENGVAQ